MTAVRSPADRLSHYQNVAAAAVQSLVVALTDTPCKAPRLLAAAGLDPCFTRLDPRDRPSISRDQFARFSRISLRTLDCHAARRDGQPPRSLSHFWLMYSCAVGAPTLRSAIETSSSIHRLLNRGRGYLTMECVGDNARLEFKGMKRELVGDDLRSVYGLSSFHRFSSWLTGVEIPLILPETEAFKPDNPNDEIIRYCIDPSGFPHYLEFDKGYLDLPVIKSYADVKGLSRNYLFDVFCSEELNSTYTGAVLDILEQYIKDHGKILDAASVANLLAVSPATLRRRLEEEETSLLDIRQTFRINLVKSFLTSTTMTLDEIADKVGYSDATAVRRAFRSRTGITPSDWKALHGGGGMTPKPTKRFWSIAA